MRFPRAGGKWTKWPGRPPGGGGDLATISSNPSAAGVNAQEGEIELMDADGCAMVAETLRNQVDTFVIRHECGDDAPLAGIVIDPLRSWWTSTGKSGATRTSPLWA
mgnify:CR=1 FL=1